jgi:hypothetical protein
MINHATKNAFSAMTGLSAGDLVQKSLENQGCSQKAAAKAGALYDLSTGNLVGFHQNMMEALTGYEPQDRPKLDSPKCARPHCAPKPGRVLKGRLQRIDLANRKGGLMGALGCAAAGFAIGGPAGAIAGGAIGFFAKRAGARCKARALEHRLNTNPAFRRRFEARIGGRYIPDGRCDGKITIVKNGRQPKIRGLRAAAFHHHLLHNCHGSVLSGLDRGFGQVGKLMENMNRAGQSQGESRIRQQAAPGSEVSKLPTPCTFEDLVAAFMIDVVKDMENELKDKMAEMESGQENGNGVGKVLGQVGSVVGGAAGSAAGSMIAPGYGTMLGGNVGASLGGQAGQAVGSALSGQGQAGDAGKDSRQINFEKIKNLMQKLQQCLQSLSNVLNTMHQGSMNAIRNIRA